MKLFWRDDEYDSLFAVHPPTRAKAPTLIESRSIARHLGRSTGSVRSQWDDARSVVCGNKSAASRALRDYLMRGGFAAGEVAPPLGPSRQSSQGTPPSTDQAGPLKPRVNWRKPIST